MELNSGIYECVVMHDRVAPKRHRFAHRTFVLALDLDEVDALAARIPWFSRNRANLLAFHDRDHLSLPGREHEGARANIAAWLRDRGITVAPDSRVILVTMPRILGYVFNPVSFYFVLDAQSTPLCAVAEVRNTFGELKPYLITNTLAARASDTAPGFQLRAPKHFYVSPFMGLDVEFDFRLRVPAERLDLRVDDFEGDQRVLRTSLIGRRTPLTSLRLLWLTLKYPLLTIRVITLIHLHAALLWLKRVPWHRKKSRPEAQRDLFRPTSEAAVR